MAFDGIVIANLAQELRGALAGGRISKIAQPEKDELLFTIKGEGGQRRLLISASASLPFIYLTETNKQGPAVAPNFCMLLRKHIGSARILSVTQPELERILVFELEHLDELGDLCHKKLIVELMGKHSNIIFCKEDGTIIDSIKHISAQVSSVREVLPGRAYFIPKTQEKLNPLTVLEDAFMAAILSAAMPLRKALYNRFTGISPVMADEICYLAGLDSDRPASDMNDNERLHLCHIFGQMMHEIRSGNFAPNIVYRVAALPAGLGTAGLGAARHGTAGHGTAGHSAVALGMAGHETVNREVARQVSADEEPIEFASLPLSVFTGANYRAEAFSSVSTLLETYYATRNTLSRIKQKSVDLRRIVQTALERNYKKYDLQQNQLADTEKKDKFRVYGEMLNTYGYELAGGEKELRCVNYYDGKEIRVPLDPQLTAQENAQKHFGKYNKLKRTHDALVDLIKETKAEIDHLESIGTALDIALKEEDLVPIKEELMEYGYVKRRASHLKKPRMTSKPFHYLSSDGFHVYVGKNNYQNEEVTFKVADGNDWWFHAKGIPGSHVVVKTEGKELPDQAFEEAGALAAYYSKGQGSDKVEIDYIQRKHVKKAAGGAPGFVVYHSNYSLIASPKIANHIINHASV